LSAEGVGFAARSWTLATEFVVGRWDWRRLTAPVSVITAVVAILIAGGVTTPEFLTVDNFLIIVRTASITGIVALGTTFVTLSGNFFSLSLEQTAAMCSIIFAEGLAHGYGLALSLVLGLLASIGIGLGQGLVVAAGLNPIVTTLGAGAALYGLAAVVTHNEVVNFSTTQANWLGTGRPLGVPTQSWAFILFTLLATLALVRTRFGRQVYLVGANRDAARASGLSVGNTTIIAFILSALAAGIAGVFTAAQITQAPLTQFDGLNFDVIAAVLVGGTALQGGEGSTLRSALGALFIALLGNFMLLRQTSFGIRTLVTGLIVIVATSAFHLLRTRSGRL
jgi:simple sugar transport system permease protein/ribose transport system permease protein